MLPILDDLEMYFITFPCRPPPPPDTGAGPSNVQVTPPSPEQRSLPLRHAKESSVLSDIAFLFIVPINVIIPIIYLMMPAYRAIKSPDKPPGTKVLAIGISFTGFIVLSYVIPYFLFWLLVKAHQYKVIRLRRYDLKSYGINIS